MAQLSGLEIQPGFIRGKIGSTFNAQLVTEFGAAFGQGLKGPVVVGRDGRASGEHFARSVISAMNAVGLEVYALGIVPTATLSVAVRELGCAGAISITPGSKNELFSGLKFLDRSGHLLTKKQFDPVLTRYKRGKFKYVAANKIGKFLMDYSCLGRHIQAVSQIPAVNLMNINRAQYTIVLDCANAGAGAVAPEFLRCLGVKVIELNCHPGVGSTHNPARANQNNKELCKVIKKTRADLGISIDADGSAITLVDELGKTLTIEQAAQLPLRQISACENGVVLLEKKKLHRLRKKLSTLDIPVADSTAITAESLASCKRARAICAMDSSGTLLYPAGSPVPDALVTIALTLSGLATSRKTLSELF